MDEAARIIRQLNLQPHPEGGFFRETFRDFGRDEGARAHSTAIYFLLRAGEVSHWHRVDAAEVWHWYRGSPLELSIHKSKHILGSDFERGEHPQIVVPPRAWQSARTLGAYTLAGCTVAPGFAFSQFELAPPDFEP